MPIHRRLFWIYLFAVLSLSAASRASGISAELVGNVGLAYGRCISILGSYAYVGIHDFGTGISGVRVIDISESGAPRLGGFHSLGGSVVQIEISASYLYALYNKSASESHIAVFSLDHPENPELVMQIDAVGVINSFGLRDNVIYLTDSEGLKILDITNPANPSHLGSYAMQRAGFLLPFSKHYLLLSNMYQDANRRNLILDVTQPENPVYRAQFSTRQFIRNGFKMDDKIILGIAFASPIEVDVSNPLQPKISESIGYFEMNVTGHGMIDNITFLFGDQYGRGLNIFDFSISKTSPVATYYANGSNYVVPEQVAVHNGLFFAVYFSEDIGLQIIRLADEAPVRVAAPVGGEVFQRGQKFSISWNTQLATAGSALQFELYDGGQLVAPLGSAWNAKGQGSVQFQMPPVPEGANYRVRAASTWNPQLSAFSTGYFTVTGSPVRVLEPNDASVIWRQGESARVRWHSDLNASGSAVALELWNGEAKVYDFGNFWDPNGEGEFQVTVPDLADGNNYRVRAVSLWNAGFFDQSDAPFSIRPQTAVQITSWMLYQ